jgi:hypothetical protein
MDEERKYAEDVLIDKYHLDVETSTHGKKFMHWVEKLAELNLSLKKKKALIVVKRAELNKDIRSNPDQYGIEKVTENAIQSAIEMDDDIQAMIQEQFLIEEDIEILKGVVEEIGGQRFMFEPLIRLYLASYYADTPIEGRREASENLKNSNLKERMEGAKRGTTEPK